MKLLFLILLFLLPTISYSEKSPKDIVREVKHLVQYKEDLIDYYQTPEETLKLGTGDCEDFALLIKKLCEENSISAKIYCLYPRNEIQGHAIVIGQYQSKYWYSSNGWFSYVDDFKSISKNIASEMHWRGDISMVTLDTLEGIKISNK